MKRILGVISAVVLVTAFCYLALAEAKKESMMDKDMANKKCMMMGKNKMTGMGCGRGMMMGKSLVATSDGGVVVMMGSKLYKYDKNLTLKKEVEIKLDTECMQKMMMPMMNKCSMKEGMMGEKGK